MAKLIIGVNDLQATDHDVAAKITSHDPKTLSRGMGKKVVSKCPKCCQHWSAPVYSLTNGCGCPVCAGRVVVVGINDLYTTDHDVAEKIVSHDPKTLSRGRDTKVISKCPKCCQHWSAMVRHLTKGSGCPVCAGQKVVAGINDLWVTDPEVAAKITSHDPKTLSRGRDTKVTSKCPKCSQHWEAALKNLTSGHGCPVCAGRVVVAGINDLYTTDSEVAAKITSHDPETLTRGSSTKVVSKCPKCSQSWTTTVNSLTNGYGCPNCSETGFTPQDKAIVYLMEQPDKMKIGITNLYGDVLENNRIKTHQGNGWELVDYIEFDVGQDAYDLEQKILAYLDAQNIGRGRAVFCDSFDGHTECWRWADYGPQSIAEIIAPSAPTISR